MPSQRPSPELTVSQVVKEALAALPELSDQQLASLYIAVETEHVNRLAAHAGHVEEPDMAF
jgi:hypothetical protein